MVRLGRTATPERPFGRDFEDLNFKWGPQSTPCYMLAHIKIRLCRIKGLKDCLTFSAENGLRSPGDKGREFFLSAHYGGSRQHPPMNDFEIREYFMDTLLRLIYSRIVIQLSVWISKWSGIWIAVQAIIKIATRISRQISGRMDIWLYGYVGCRLNMHIAT